MIVEVDEGCVSRDYTSFLSTRTTSPWQFLAFLHELNFHVFCTPLSGISQRLEREPLQMFTHEAEHERLISPGDLAHDPSHTRLCKAPLPLHDCSARLPDMVMKLGLSAMLDEADDACARLPHVFGIPPRADALPRGVAVHVDETRQHARREAVYNIPRRNEIVAKHRLHFVQAGEWEQATRLEDVPNVKRAGQLVLRERAFKCKAHKPGIEVTRPPNAQAVVARPARRRGAHGGHFDAAARSLVAQIARQPLAVRLGGGVFQTGLQVGHERAGGWARPRGRWNVARAREAGGLSWASGGAEDSRHVRWQWERGDEEDHRVESN